MIIDGHAHMITESIAKDMGADLEKYPAMKEMAKHSVQENTEIWLAVMNELEIEKTVFMANASLNKDFIDFINSSYRFIGMARINPTLPDAISVLEKEISFGMKGIKFYATNDGFDVSSKTIYPFYEYCQKNKIPIVIHFGVTVGWQSDLIKGNPLMLSKVLKDFPQLNFVIAHFGSGFFREVLMLKYKNENLYLDTSGTNNWLPYQDNFLSLRDVFRKAIEIFTPQRIIFGTDTRIFPDGYRKNILQEQKMILDNLELKQKDKEDIFMNNAKRVFNT